VLYITDERTSTGGRGIAKIVLGVGGFFLALALLLPAHRSSREAARRAQCVGHLKKIGLAMHNYHESNGCLPPAAIVNKDGKPLLSWRVAILPFIQQKELYDQFHLDESWDSPHNLTLLEAMPLIYSCPADKAREPGMTGYQVAIGPDTAFTPNFEPLMFEDFTDGTSNTLLAGESLREVPWTKPEDLPTGTNLPLAGLGSHHGYHDNGFNVLFADGFIRFLKRTISPETLEAILTRDGGEAIGGSCY
jgi:prepilin-type processing-associated H-X9-DG protein